VIPSGRFSRVHEQVSGETFMNTSKSVRLAYARCLQILLLLLVAGVAQAQSKVEMVASPGSAAPGTTIQVNLSYLTVGTQLPAAPGEQQRPPADHDAHGGGQVRKAVGERAQCSGRLLCAATPARAFGTVIDDEVKFTVVSALGSA
jgi:hypothetical protein